MSQTPKVVAILAGGKATRFGGQDKGEIILNNRRLIDIIHSRLRPQATDIIISGKHDYRLGLECVADSEKAPGGPVGGLYSIWQKLAPRNVEGFFTVAVDGPNLPLDLTDRLYLSTGSAIACDDLGRHPTYGWWRIADLARFFQDVDFQRSFSLKNLATDIGASDVFWPGERQFININRPEDMENLSG